MNLLHNKQNILIFMWMILLIALMLESGLSVIHADNIQRKNQTEYAGTNLQPITAIARPLLHGGTSEVDPQIKSNILPTPSNTLSNTVFLPILLRPVTILNGFFESGQLTSWSASGVMNSDVVGQIDIDGRMGNQFEDALDGSFSALLGSPNYVNHGGVPTGFAEIRQTINLSNNANMIRLRYKIVTHDRIIGPDNLYFDTFEVYIDSTIVSDAQRDTRCQTNVGIGSTNAQGLVLCDGNIDLASEDSSPIALPTQTVEIDVSAKAGQTITLIIRVINRIDGFYNTWAYVDAIEEILDN